MDSMLDLEQLRHSVIEQDIPSAIGQVQQWIDSHGLTLLGANQRLPFDYNEAEAIRKDHEKIELKCMTFLAFYAKINLKNIPEQYQEMREDMDIKIHKFSEHIKARRHVVVSFYTLFRHYEKLREKLAEIQNEDLSNLPDTLEEINALIEDFNRNINHSVKRLSHLKLEGDRVKSSLNMVVDLNNSPSFDYINRPRVEEAKQNIDALLREAEEDVTRIFESQRILELELKIEAKMMIIEDDMTRCCGWLQKMEQKLVDRYNAKIVGMATVENDVLHKEAEELVEKMKATKEYGDRLMGMYEELCNQFKRDTSRGQASKDKFDELWELGELISPECLNRLSKAGKLFHGLDSTLNKVEDMLLSINKDKEANVPHEEIVENYNGVRNEARGELQNMQQSAKELFSKLRYDLYNNKIKPTNGVNVEAEQTEDMVRMKIFTIAVKLKELDRCLFQDEPEDVSQERPDMPDELLDNINKYIKFLNSTRLNWESKPLPVTLNQAIKALKEHQDIAATSEQYWHDIQTVVSSKGFQSKTDNQNQQRLLAEATREKTKWDDKWNTHLEQQLNPRHSFLRQLKDFTDELDNNQVALEDLVDRPNHNLALVKDVEKDLIKMKSQIPKKEQTMDKLYQEGLNIHQTQFNDALSAAEDKLNKYRDNLFNFIELEQIIDEILEFLPELKEFKKEWPNRVTKYLTNPKELRGLQREADGIIARINSFDVDKLQDLATASYGNNKRIQWLIDELQAEFEVPEFMEERVLPQQSAIDTTDGPVREFSVNAVQHSEADLNFEIEALPKANRDQYNIQWYKNNAALDPSRDGRITTLSDPSQGHLNMKIERVDFGDAGKYWCEVQDASDNVHTSFLVNLTVSPKKSSPLGTVDPLFGEKIFAGRQDPLTLELNLVGYRFAPDMDIVHNKKPLIVNQRECAWTRVSTNSNIEFSHPQIADSDSGKYEFVIEDKVVAKTEVVVGDAPKLLQHNFVEKVRVGDQVSVAIPTANIANKADQKVIWRLDDQVLTPGAGKFNWRVNRNGDPVFEVAQVRASHAGVYTCEIYNDYGRTSAQLVLDVENEVKQLPKTSFANDGSTVEELSANVGESVILAIDYSPARNSEIIWTKEGKPVNTMDSRVKISNESNTRCILHIKSARVTDSGLYTATVKGTNRKHSVNLEIIPAVPGPVIEQYPQSMRLRVNEPLNLDCVVRSIPSCDDIKWTLHPVDGGTPRNIIDGAKCKLTTTNIGNPLDNLQQFGLYIDRASRSDAGEYVLRCENSVGWSSVKIPVTIIDDAQNKRKPPAFVSALKRELTCRGDEPIILKCKVVGNPFPVVKWTKNGREVTPTDFIKIKTTGDVHELNILNPRASDAATYEVIASNSEGVEKCQCSLKILDPQELPPVSEEVTVPSKAANNQSAPDVMDSGDQNPQRTQLIFSNTVVRAPPQFVTTFTDEIVQEGDDVCLKCCLIGQPEPVVWWSYNTHLLKNPRFEITRQVDEYSLVMRNVQEEDSGRYSMTAENSSGLATCSALVIVDKNQNKGRSLDRSQYKTSSKPMNADGRSSPFPCHATLSNTINPNLSDESRVMQVSPRGWDDKPKSSNSSPRHLKNELESDVSPNDSLDFTQSKTKTVKTYRYSGPSGVDLPGIGFIPKTHPSSTNASSASSDDIVTRAVFKPGKTGPPVLPKPVIPERNPYTDDMSRFSYVESSECDYPL